MPIQTGARCPELSLGCPGLWQLSATPPVLQPLLSLRPGRVSVPLRSSSAFLPSSWLVFHHLWLNDSDAGCFFLPRSDPLLKAMTLAFPTQTRIFPTFCSGRLMSLESQRSRDIGARSGGEALEGEGEEHMLQGSSEVPGDRLQGTGHAIPYSTTEHRIQCYMLSPSALCHIITHPPAL